MLAELRTVLSDITERQHRIDGAVGQQLTDARSIATDAEQVTRTVRTIEEDVGELAGIVADEHGAAAGAGAATSVGDTVAGTRRAGGVASDHPPARGPDHLVGAR